MSKRWTRTLCLGILCVLCLSLSLRAAEAAVAPGDQETTASARADQEEQLARDAELITLKRRLRRLRRRYADVYLQARELERELALYRQRVADMLHTGGEAGESEKALALALDALDQRREERDRLCARIRDFRQYLETVLDVLQPSEVLRRELTERGEALESACQRSDRVPSLVAWRGGQSLEQRECRVLAVHDDLQVVVIDAGVRHGVQPGMLWYVTDGNEVIAKLRVIETRSIVSATMVIEGSLREVAPGLAVKLGDRTVEER